MLRQVAEGVLIHQSELLQNNAVVVRGRSGVLLVDPGIKGDEMACLANDIRELGQPVVAGFSTHPDWDHVLWHAELGEAPRYGTARCAAYMRDLLAKAGWKARVAEGCRRKSPRMYRWTCSASLPVCLPKPRGFLGMALKSGLLSIRLMPRAMRRC
ncbi:MBL fold metallo-hydrolase [Streptomyces rectiviolaceus]|uniref:MBL fold metallo-hydrolase n=1 Tax=Streptomyces rectiviolaceus TaxID=332591 RepID=UPI0036436781